MAPKKAKAAAAKPKGRKATLRPSPRSKKTVPDEPAEDSDVEPHTPPSRGRANTRSSSRGGSASRGRSGTAVPSPPAKQPQGKGKSAAQPPPEADEADESEPVPPPNAPKKPAKVPKSKKPAQSAGAPDGEPAKGNSILQFGAFYDGSNLSVISALPSLSEHPEVLTKEVEVDLAKEKVQSMEYNLPLNYGFLPVHKIKNNEGEVARLAWWDLEDDAMEFTNLKPRIPSDAESARNQGWVGKQHRRVTLFYPLTATGVNAMELGEILGLKTVKLVYEHQTTIGKAE